VGNNPQVQQNLNRQQVMRDRGQQRAQNFQQSRTYSRPSGGYSAPRSSGGGGRPSGGGGGSRPSGGGGGHKH
jgi:hypothetical protein